LVFPFIFKKKCKYCHSVEGKTKPLFLLISKPTATVHYFIKLWIANLGGSFFDVHMGESERLLRFANDRPFSKSLVIIALQIAIISGLLSFYNMEIPSQPAFRWIKHQIYKVFSPTFSS
jgi:hypothetical protein